MGQPAGYPSGETTSLAGTHIFHRTTSFQNRATPLLSAPIPTSSRANCPVVLRRHDTMPLSSRPFDRKQAAFRPAMTKFHLTGRWFARGIFPFDALQFRRFPPQTVRSPVGMRKTHGSA